MAPKKLTDADKQHILKRYRQTDETTATLASQYGVSTSTISRLLKQSLSEKEYESLIQQKRSGSFRAYQEPEEPDLEFDAEPDSELDEEPTLVSSQADLVAVNPSSASVAPPQRRQRKRSSSTGVDQLTLPEDVIQPQVTPSAESDYQPSGFAKLESEPLLTNEEFTELTDLDDEEDLEEEDLDDDLDGLDDDDDDFDDDEAELEGAVGFNAVQIQTEGKIRVLPLSEAQIPRTCYVVVDRSAELITHPLKDFAELGQIPANETQERTLPIFDNHRVAKRFLRRMQRVVKVPDGRIFQKVKPYLQAKGITRLLIDGQVYSL